MAKVEEYQQMMAWLTRPKSKFQEPRIMDQAALSDDVVPGPLKDELAGNFDPSQETYEEYLQRINLERPFNMAEGGQLVKPSVDGSRPGYRGRPGGNPEFGKTITGARFKGTIRPQNLEKLKKLEEIITKSNSQYKKSLTSKAALELAGFKGGYQAIQTGGPLRDEVRKVISTLQSTGDKMDNYINNVMLSEDALVKDFKNPMQHLQKKFGVSRGFTDKWAPTSQVVQDNKRLFNNLANDLSFNKYKKYADGTPRLMSDFSVVVQNKLPSSTSLLRGDSAEKFILQSAYRHFKYNKDVGKASKINFIGDPDLLPINEWKFIKGGKLFSLDPAEDTIKFQGKNYKNNYLNRVDAKDIYKNDFGDVYKIFDDLDKYMNTTTIVGNKDVKLDTVLRRKLFDATGKKDYLLRRAIEIDHFDINKDPFSNLRLLDRRTNVQAGLIKRLPKYKNNPKLLNKVLTDIGYTTPYKNVDTFIKRTIKNIDTPIKTLTSKPGPGFKIPRGIGEAGFIQRELLEAPARGIGKGIRIAGKYFGIPDAIFYYIDKQNMLSKGMPEAEAQEQALKNATFGLYKSNNEYMKGLKKTAESMGIDARAFDEVYKLNVAGQTFDKYFVKGKERIENLRKLGYGKEADDLQKNLDRYMKEQNEKLGNLSQKVIDQVSISKAGGAASPLQLSKAKDAITQEDFYKPFKDITKVAKEKLKREAQSVYPQQATKVDPAEGKWGTRFFDTLDFLGQGFKNIALGSINPKLMDLSERQKEARYLKEMEPRELYLYNKARGLTYDQPLTEGGIMDLKYNQPGVFFSTGGLASIRRPHAIPPKSGPNPQGLPSMYNRVKRI